MQATLSYMRTGKNQIEQEPNPNRKHTEKHASAERTLTGLLKTFHVALVGGCGDRTVIFGCVGVGCGRSDSIGRYGMGLDDQPPAGEW